MRHASLILQPAMFYESITVGLYEVTDVAIELSDTCNEPTIQLSFQDDRSPLTGLVDKLVNLGEYNPFYIEKYCENRPSNRYKLRSDTMVDYLRQSGAGTCISRSVPLYDVMKNQALFTVRVNYTFHNVEVKVKSSPEETVSVVTYDSVTLEIREPLRTFGS